MNDSKTKATKKSINFNRLYKACPELVNHEILDTWIEGDHAVVIKSKFTNEYGTQIYLTRLTF